MSAKPLASLIKERGGNLNAARSVQILQKHSGGGLAEEVPMKIVTEQQN
jgi:hypothetical protein